MASIIPDNLKIIGELTFEDWKKGMIPVPHKYWEKLYNYGRWPNGIKTEENAFSYSKHWAMFNNPPLMEMEELNKIKKEQIRIYNIGIKIMVASRVHSLLNDIVELPEYEKQDIIEDEINVLENKLPNKLKRRLRRGETEQEYVNPARRKEVLDYLEEFKAGRRIFSVTYPGVIIVSDDSNEIIDDAPEFDEIYLGDLFTAHINYGYLLELKKLANEGTDSYLTEDETKEGKPSNSAVIYKAEEWLVPLITKIGKLDSPVDEIDVIKELEEVYPDFRDEFNPEDFEELKSPLASGGTVTKKSTSIAIAYILKQKEGIEIPFDTIRRKYSSDPWNLW